MLNCVSSISKIKNNLCPTCMYRCTMSFSLQILFFPPEFLTFLFLDYVIVKNVKGNIGRCFDFTIFIMCLVFPHFSGFLCTFSLTGSTEYVER